MKSTALRDDFYTKLLNLRAGEHYVYYTTRRKGPLDSDPIFRREQWKFDVVMEAYNQGYGVPVQDLLSRTNDDGLPQGQYNYLFIRNRKK